MKINPCVFALTGGIGCGKSYIAHLLMKQFDNLCMSSFDVDWNNYLKENIEIQDKIRGLFGSVCFEYGYLDKQMLSSLVFANTKSWEKYCALIRNDVLSVFEKTLSETANVSLSCCNAFMYEVPLLFEYNLQDRFDFVICVACDKTKQIERICKRNNITENDAIKRISFQGSLDRKIESSDIIIWNNSDFESERIDNIVQRIYNSAKAINSYVVGLSSSGGSKLRTCEFHTCF